MRSSALLFCSALLLSLGDALANRLDGGPGPSPYFGPSGPESGMRIQDVSNRLDYSVHLLDQYRNDYDLANIPKAAAPLQQALSLIPQIRQSLAAGNVPLASNQCTQLGNLIIQLGTIGREKSMDGLRYGGVTDSSRFRIDQRAADFQIQGLAGQLDYLSQRLESSKNPQAAALLDKARALLDAARSEAAAGRTQTALNLVSQAAPLLNELQLLRQALTQTDPRNGAAPSRDPVKDQQSALAQAEANYLRVHNAAVRLGERPVDGEDPKIASLRARVFELLEKAKDALAAAQPEAVKGYCLKAENALTEWHRTLAAKDKLSPGTRERVKAKLDLAAGLVSASGNEKAARILEKAREHFDRAESGRADGHSALAGVEMDLALKLAAKAVDIARSGSR